MPLLTDIPSDIAVEILSDWIRGWAIVAVDTAYCSRKFRAELLQIFKFVKIADMEDSVFYKYVIHRNLCLTSFHINFKIFPFLNLLNHTSVKQIYFTNGQKRISEADISMVNRCINLDCLHCAIGGVGRLLQNMTYLKNITSLSLLYNDSLQVIADCCRNLKALWIYNGYSDLCDIIVKNNCALRVVRISGARFLSIALHCPDIEEVEATGDIRDFQFAVDLVVSRPKLKYIHLEELFMYVKRDNSVTVSQELAALAESDKLRLWYLKDIRTAYFHGLSLLIPSGFDTFISNNCNTLVSLISGFIDAAALKLILVHCHLLESLCIKYRVADNEELKRFAGIFKECKPVCMKVFELLQKYDSQADPITYRDALTIIESASNLRECSLSIVAPLIGNEFKLFQSALSELHNSGRSLHCWFECLTNDVGDRNYDVKFVNGTFEREYR